MILNFATFQHLICTSIPGTCAFFFLLRRRFYNCHYLYFLFLKLPLYYISLFFILFLLDIYSFSLTRLAFCIASFYFISSSFLLVTRSFVLPSAWRCLHIHIPIVLLLIFSHFLFLSSLGRLSLLLVFIAFLILTTKCTYNIVLHIYLPDLLDKLLVEWFHTCF